MAIAEAIFSMCDLSHFSLRDSPGREMPIVSSRMPSPPPRWGCASFTGGPHLSLNLHFSLTPLLLPVSLAFLWDSWAFHSISLGPGACLLLTSAEQWRLLSQTPLRERSPRAEGHAGEEVTLGECWCFGFSESCKNVALSEQVKKKKNQCHLPQMILFLRLWSRSW